MSGNKKYIVTNLVASVYSKETPKILISKRFGINRDDIKDCVVIRKSIDARKKSDIKYNYTCIVEFYDNIPKNLNLTEFKPPEPDICPIHRPSDKHPFIIGEGPAGLFAALGLVEKGYIPYIFEKGEPIGDREKSVSKFWNNAILNPYSNVQFGEGGAGTFSDGKLTARNRNYYSDKVYDYLIKFGAPKNIKTDYLPHLGTDQIRKIVVKIREYLISKNVKFFWNSSLNDIIVKNNKIIGIRINDEIYSPEILILAVGNSARDVFRLLKQKQVAITSKPFAIGFRIEHPQEFINRTIYGNAYKILGNASYKLTAKLKDRGAYSFCMCPGGFVVAATSEKNMQVTNGMSFSNRDNYFANSAIVVTVSEKDFGNYPLSGLEYQTILERKAFTKHFPYFSPFQKADDFIQNKLTKKIGSNSYKPGVYRYNFNNLFSFEIAHSLKDALMKFDKKIKGFVKYGNLLGVETRTSSPIRILRDKNGFNSLNIRNLFPIGEGSGYAGGIISSAADGYKLSQTFFSLS